MRILHLIYTTGVSGAEKHLLDLLPDLKKHDINCELLCICLKKNIISLQEYCFQMNEKGVKATLLPITTKISFLNTARIICRYLKSNNIRIVHSHLFSADLIAVLIKKLYFKNLIILSTKHGYEEKYLVRYGLGNKKIRYNLYYFISWLVIKNVNHNLAISRAISEMYDYLKLGKSKMHFIHHGINIQPNNENRVQLPGEPKIIIIGRLSKMKGHEYLIKALPGILKKFPQLKLIILGIGPLKDELIKLAESINVLQHIEFVGFVSPNSYIFQCQVMILPSLFEPFGLVYIESFASKIPVIAFDTQAANEIIEHNVTGILVERENIHILANKIIYLLESPEERNRIVENAYIKFKAYFNVERMGKETAEWYHSVLKHV